MSSEVIVDVKNLSKKYEIYSQPYHRLLQTLFMGHRQFYKEFYALKDISFTVRKGECIGIIGRNGAGKSTLLQVLAETLFPTSGEVNINGRIAALLELGSGFNPEFTGVENIYMYGAILGLNNQQINERYQKIVDFADIGDAINQPVKTYSSGMAMRLAFAVAAHIDADILIVDEALAVGDVVFVQKCFAFLRNFIKDHTVILVTHDIASVRDLCGRVIWLKDGRIEADGDPRTVTDDYLAYCYEDTSSAESKDEVETVAEEKAVEKITEKTTVTRACDTRLALWEEHPEAVPLYKIFEFDENAPSFGKGGAKMRKVAFCDEEGNTLRAVSGGERVRLVFEIDILEDMSSPIVGFSFRNNRGENLFGDNTFECYQNNPVRLSAGEVLEAVFEFEMPRLPSGEYAMHAAIADGTQDEHVQHQWFHNCLTMTSLYHGKTGVLVGIPMHGISLKKLGK
jgi:lipopolysaccharide transport system ATP-binding protein